MPPASLCVSECPDKGAIGGGKTKPKPTSVNVCRSTDNSEGNQGEDVKEFYFYLHSTPTHSYLKYLYNYPQVRYPYADLVEASRRRMKNDTELQTDPYWRDNIYSMNTSMATMVPGWAPITRPV